jgi:hypothetical protein
MLFTVSSKCQLETTYRTAPQPEEGRYDAAVIEMTLPPLAAAPSTAPNAVIVYSS